MSSQLLLTDSYYIKALTQENTYTYFEKCIMMFSYNNISYRHIVQPK